MTYDIALWKAKRGATDSAGLIAITLADGHECTAVARFPRTKLIKCLEERFESSFDSLPFEIDITGQGAIFGIPQGSNFEKCLVAVTEIAASLGLYIFDFQSTAPSDSDEQELERRVRAQAASGEAAEFQFSLQNAQEGNVYEMHKVAGCFRYGTGVIKNLNEAIAWYERATTAGLKRAVASLADLYREDLADDASLKKGVELLRSSVASGNVFAMATLAEWLRDGVGGPSDATAAVALWCQLLEADSCVAAFELARAYEHGNGVEKSLDSAIKYFRASRAAGHPEALKNLRRLGAEP